MRQDAARIKKLKEASRQRLVAMKSLWFQGVAKDLSAGLGPSFTEVLRPHPSVRKTPGPNMSWSNHGISDSLVVETNNPAIGILSSQHRIHMRPRLIDDSKEWMLLGTEANTICSVARPSWSQMPNSRPAYELIEYQHDSFLTFEYALNITAY